MLAKLGSYTAVALYEICARYRDNPSGVTSRKPVAWWVDALSNGPGPERREWRKFKNERVKEAVAEINAETDLEIELIEHKQGRVITEVQFAVRKKRQAAARAGRSPAAGGCQRWCCAPRRWASARSSWKGCIKEFGDERVREQIEVLERRAANKSLARRSRTPSPTCARCCATSPASDGAAEGPSADRRAGGAAAGRPWTAPAPAPTVAKVQLAARADRGHEEGSRRARAGASSSAGSTGRCRTWRARAP